MYVCMYIYINQEMVRLFPENTIDVTYKRNKEEFKEKTISIS